MKNCPQIVVMMILFVLSFSSLGMVQAPSLEQKKVLSILNLEAGEMDFMAKKEMTQMVLSLAKEYRLDPILILAVIHVESRFKPAARSNRGAIGLMQIKPIVVKDVADELGIETQNSHQKLLGKEFNMRVGVHYLSNLIKRFKGDIHKALMAYNMGPTAVSKLYKNRSVPLGGYQGKVLKVYKNYSHLSS